MNSYYDQKNKKLMILKEEVLNIFLEEYISNIKNIKKYLIVDFNTENLIKIKNIIYKTNLFFSNTDLLAILIDLQKKNIHHFDAIFNLLPSKKLILNAQAGFGVYQEDNFIDKNYVIVAPKMQTNHFKQKKDLSFNPYSFRKKFQEGFFNDYHHFVFFETHSGVDKKIIDLYKNYNFTIFTNFHNKDILLFLNKQSKFNIINFVDYIKTI